MENGVLIFIFTPPVTELLRIKFVVFNIVAPPKQTRSQRSKTHCLYNQDIKSTKWQITIIIEKM